MSAWPAAVGVSATSVKVRPATIAQRAKASRHMVASADWATGSTKLLKGALLPG
jgi:hypothetical protein